MTSHEKVQLIYNLISKAEEELQDVKLSCLYEFLYWDAQEKVIKYYNLDQALKEVDFKYVLEYLDLLMPLVTLATSQFEERMKNFEINKNLLLFFNVK